MRVADDGAIELRVAAAACMGHARPLVGHAPDADERESPRVERIEHDREAGDPTEQQKRRRDEGRREAPPGDRPGASPLRTGSEMNS